jgi:hypothetical protein
MMVKHVAVAEGGEVDVANLAMILGSLRRRGGEEWWRGANGWDCRGGS